MPITDEMIVDDITSSVEIQIEVQVLIEVPVIIETVDNKAQPMISPEMLAQADDIRKLILLQETIKRFSKKQI